MSVKGYKKNCHHFGCAFYYVLLRCFACVCLHIFVFSFRFQMSLNMPGMVTDDNNIDSKQNVCLKTIINLSRSDSVQSAPTFPDRSFWLKISIKHTEITFYICLHYRSWTRYFALLTQTKPTVSVRSGPIYFPGLFAAPVWILGFH